MNRATRTGLLSMAMLLVVGWQTHGDTFTVTLTPMAGAESLPGRVVVETTAPASAESELREHEIAGPSLTIVRPPPPAAARISCRGAAHWCPTLTLPADASELDLVVFSTTPATVRWTPPRGETAPEEMLVQGWIERPGHERPWELRRRVAVVDRELAISLPRTTLDLRFAADGWAPTYRWGVEVGDEPVHLGNLPLARGGSLAGFVLDEESRPLPTAELTVSPLRSGGADDPRSLRFDRSATADDHGFFQLRGVPEGLYRLQVSHEDKAPLTLQPVAVEPDAETFLSQQLRLRALAILEIAVDPPFGPDGLQWTVELQPPPGAESPPRSPTDAYGSAHLEGLVPGSYRLRLWTGERSLALQRRVEVGDDETLLLEPDLVRVRGRLLLGDEPLAANLRLTTGESDSWSFDSDDEGRFEGGMRRPDEVLVATVRAREPALRAQYEVTDREIGEDGVLELEIRLPDLEISGLVLESTAAPAAGARVEVDAVDGRRDASVRTDEQGRFTVHALSSGEYWLRAEGGVRGDAGPERMTLEDDGLPRTIVLRLSRGEDFTGTLTTRSGTPLAGAGLRFLSLGPPHAVAEAVSDAAGRFSVRLPTPSGRAVVQVTAPSRLAWSGCIRWSEGDELAIHVPDTTGGELVVETLGDPDLPPTQGGEMLLLGSEGGLFTFGALDRWANDLGAAPPEIDQEGARIVRRIPALAAGSYAVTWTTEPWWLWAERMCVGAHPADAEWRWLDPGGELRLDHDHRPHQRSQAER